MSVAVPSTPQSAVDRLRHAQHLRRQADAIELQAIADELDVTNERAVRVGLRLTP